MDDGLDVIECKKLLVATMNPSTSRVRNYHGPSRADFITNLRTEIKKQVGVSYPVEVIFLKKNVLKNIE